MRRVRPPSGNDQLTQSDISRDRPATPVATAPLRPREQRQINNEHAQAQGAALLHQMVAHLGGILDLNRTAAEGDVLLEGAYIIPSNGVFVRSYPAGFAAVSVANQGGALLTVASQTAQSQAPSQGVGNFRLPPGIQRTVNMHGTALAIYGPPGTPFDVVFYSRPRDPEVGIVNRGPADGVIVPSLTIASSTTLLTGNLERLVVITNVSNVAGGSVQVTLNGITPSGYVYPLLVGLAQTVGGAVPLRVGPALNSSTNAVANDVVPRVVQIVATVAGSIAYGIDFEAG
jgi:hypothetical protein